MRARFPPIPEVSGSLRRYWISVEMSQEGDKIKEENRWAVKYGKSSSWTTKSPVYTHLGGRAFTVVKGLRLARTLVLPLSLSVVCRPYRRGSGDWLPRTQWPATCEQLLFYLVHNGRHNREEEEDGSSTWMWTTTSSKVDVSMTASRWVVGGAGLLFFPITISKRRMKLPFTQIPNVHHRHNLAAPAIGYFARGLSPSGTKWKDGREFPHQLDCHRLLWHLAARKRLLCIMKEVNNRRDFFLCHIFHTARAISIRDKREPPWTEHTLYIIQ